MKNVKIIMSSGKEYYCIGLNLQKVIDMVINKDGSFKQHSILINGEDMPNKILLNPTLICSIEEEDIES